MRTKEKGITLIALVITVVIIILLASVSIILSLGKNGLAQTAKNATEKYANAQEYEEMQLAQVDDEIDNQVNGNRDYEAEIKELKAEIEKLKNANANLNSYSINERVIGTWVNGKPLYEKTLIIDAPENEVTSRHYTTVYTMPSEVDMGYIEYGNSWFEYSDGNGTYKQPLSFYLNSNATFSSDEYWGFRYNQKTTGQHTISYLTQGNNWLVSTTGCKFYITVRYTKSIDN